jgi:hypothetical protein
MNARNSLALTLLLILTGCASEALRQSEALAGEQRCCKRFQDLPFADVATGKPVTVSVTIDSPSFRFQNGKSFVASLRLPTDRNRGFARLKTFSVTRHITQESEVFCPKIYFLDSDYGVIPDSATSLPLSYAAPGLLQSGYWYSDFAIPTNARFAILYTPMLVVGNAVSYEGVSLGSPVVIGKQPVYQPSYTVTERMPCGQIGEMEIEVR